MTKRPQSDIEGNKNEAAQVTVLMSDNNKPFTNSKNLAVQLETKIQCTDAFLFLWVNKVKKTFRNYRRSVFLTDIVHL